MNRPPSQLLADIDRLARNLLAAPDPLAGVSSYAAWADMITAASAAWRATSHPGTAPSADPFAVIISIDGAADQLGRSLTRSEPRMAAITARLHDVAATVNSMRAGGQPRSPLRQDRLQASILHSAYLVTHATAIALRREYQATTRPNTTTVLRGALDRVGTAEQILDIHLHQPIRDKHESVGQLGAALTAWNTTAQRALRLEPLEPKNFYIICDVQTGLLAHTSAFVRTDPTVRDDARTRVLPAIAGSARHWQAVRDSWARLASPDTGISRDLANTAADLKHALCDPPLSAVPGVTYVLVGALAASVETSWRMQGLFDSHQLRVPTQTVVALTREAVDRNPDQEAFQVWRRIPRVTGKAPIQLPTPLRRELVQLATDNTTAARILRSATYALLRTDTRQTSLAYRSTTPPRDQSPRRTSTPAIGR